MILFERDLGALPQGDITITAVPTVPDGEPVAAIGGHVIVAHSETGHHHQFDERLARLERADPWTCYLHVTAEYCDLIHARDAHPHETVRLPTGAYRVTRQREWTPEGWRAVQD